MLKGSPVKLAGKFIKVDAVAPEFELVRSDLTPLRLADLHGKRVVLNIFPSLDTDICAMSVRRFNSIAENMPDTVVVAVSKDLPFAHARFCSIEGIKDIVPASDFRCSDFGTKYGVLIEDGAMRGLFARAVVIIDRTGKVAYTELVPDIASEPDYDRAVEALKKLG